MNQRKVLRYDAWLTLRTFIALFLILFGVGLMFVHAEDNRILLGAVFAAIGLTFVLRMVLVLRQH